MPWNWCFGVEKLFLYEQSVAPPELVAQLRAALEDEIRAVRAAATLPGTSAGASNGYRALS
jgi:hypothetical protein